jgi:hypothetical protein
MEILRRTLAEQQSNPGKIIPTPQAPRWSTNSPLYPRFLELERAFLDGKLTAKGYQKALDDLRRGGRTDGELSALSSPPAKPPAAPVNRASPPKEAGSAPAAASNPSNPANTNAPPNSEAEAAARQKRVSDVESKLDEMMRLKAAREKAALTNATAATNAVPGKLTKRQRLDLILKQYVEGKLTEADYNVQRTKIVAEPD